MNLKENIYHSNDMNYKPNINQKCIMNQICDLIPKSIVQIKKEVYLWKMTKKKEKDFLNLWENGMKWFRDGDIHWQVRWCVKQQLQISFEQLKDLKCWNCKDFVCNKGICDPI